MPLLFLFLPCKMLRSLGFKRVTAIGWYVLIILGSSVPGKKIPEIFTLTPDKLIHCVEYFALGFLLSRWFVAEWSSVAITRIGLAIIIAGSLCGIMDELYQNLTPNRTPDFYDWCLDFTGVAVSFPVFSFLRGKLSWV
jgi:VanZ family protein